VKAVDIEYGAALCAGAPKIEDNVDMPAAFFHVVVVYGIVMVLFEGPLPFEVSGGMYGDVGYNGESEIIGGEKVADAGIGEQGPTTLEAEVAVVVTHGRHDWLQEKQLKIEWLAFWLPMGF
jgi:hypothetical protein